MEPDVTLRRASAADKGFAFAVKEAAFREYVEQAKGWDEKEQKNLHEVRFARQDFWIIQAFGSDAGVLSTADRPDAVTLYQLYLLPEYQNKGIGTACVKGLLEDAGERPVRLQVLKVNGRAIEFYKRMGFLAVGETEYHIQMERLFR